MKDFNTKRIVVTSFMIALSIVLSRILSIQTPISKIGFYYLPIALIAMMYGPLWSGAAWGIADVIGALMFPTGAYFFGFTLSAIIKGLLLGVFLYRHDKSVWRPVVVSVLSAVFVTLGIDVLWLVAYFGRAAAAVWSARIVQCAITVPVQSILIISMGRIFGSLIYHNGTLYQRKKAVRKEISSKYSSDEFNRGEISSVICNKVISTDLYKNAKTVFCFVGTRREVDTRAILENVIESGKTLCVPMTDNHNLMSMRIIESLDQLREGRHGILEPDSGCSELHSSDIDLAIIPCIACDEKHHRLGHGSGVYDNFMRHYKRTKGTSITICPDFALLKKVPYGDHDTSISTVITEKRTVN